MQKRKVVTKSFCMSPENLQLVKEKAKKEDRTDSYIINMILTKYFEKISERN